MCVGLIGEHYVTHSYRQSGDVQWFSILALNNNTRVTVQRPGAEYQTYKIGRAHV